MTTLQDASAAGMIVILLGTAIGILSVVVESSKWWERVNQRFWKLEIIDTFEEIEDPVTANSIENREV